jgi:hypothetical protein
MYRTANTPLFFESGSPIRQLLAKVFARKAEHWQNAVTGAYA